MPSPRLPPDAALPVGNGAASVPRGPCRCVICGYETGEPEPRQLGRVRGNTARFRSTLFALWKCPRCGSIHSLDPVDFRDIYADYPLNKRRLDVFARGTLRNLAKRLRRAGIGKATSILDYGCGNGVLIRYLRRSGFTSVSGYDPYIPEYAKPPASLFDCVIANDVIEHVPDPRRTIRECSSLVEPGGVLYVGTADAAAIEMHDLDTHIMALHQPFHRVIVTQQSLIDLAMETGLKLVRTYRRSYMDTALPFANYRFLEEFNAALGHDLDAALDPSSNAVVLRKPKLLFYALFGYLCPSAYEPAVVLRKPATMTA